MVLGIWRIEKALPECLGVPQIQWVIWAYAVFQLVRRNLFFLLIISLAVFIIKGICYLLFYGRDPVDVYLIPYALRRGEDYVKREREEDGNVYFQRHPPKTFRVVPRDESWPSDWRVVEFNGWQYITTKSALNTMATWISLHCDGDDRKALFLLKVGVTRINERISREEAYEKIFSGSYLVGELHTVPSAISFAYGRIPSAISFSEMNGKLWGVLSTIPVLLQAWNYNRTSTFVAFVIILLDFFRSVVNKIYHRLCLNIRLFVKSKLNMDRINGNRCLEVTFILITAVLGPRWKPAVLGPRWKPIGYLNGEYVAEEGMEIRVYPHCKVKSVEDVMTISGSGYYTTCEEAHPVEDQIHVYDPNDNPMLMLRGKRAVLVWNLSHPAKVQFGIAKLKKRMVVEHSL